MLGTFGLWRAESSSFWSVILDETIGGAVSVIQSPSRRTHFVGCAWFWAWALVGCAAALGAVSLGPLLFVPVAIPAVWMASRSRIRRSAFGLLTGAGALFLFVAYLNRQGAATTCYQHGAVSGCDSHLNPLPWLLVGIAMVVGGIIAHARRSR